MMETDVEPWAPLKLKKKISGTEDTTSAILELEGDTRDDEPGRHRPTGIKVLPSSPWLTAVVSTDVLDSHWIVSICTRQHDISGCATQDCNGLRSRG